MKYSTWQTVNLILFYFCRAWKLIFAMYADGCVIKMLHTFSLKYFNGLFAYILCPANQAYFIAFFYFIHW